jgi:hypothetical protein
MTMTNHDQPPTDDYRQPTAMNDGHDADPYGTFTYLYFLRLLK